jgi:hypothetical protein
MRAQLRLRKAKCSSLTRRKPEVAPPAVSQDHPDRIQLQCFMSGDLPRAEVAPIVRHMLTGCPQCLQVTRQLWELIEQLAR